MEDQLLFGCAPGHELNVVEEQKHNLSSATTPHGELRCADEQTRVWLRAGYGYGPYGTGASTEMRGCHETGVFSHNIPAALVATAPGEYEDQKKDVAAAGLKGLFALGGKKVNTGSNSYAYMKPLKLHLLIRIVGQFQYFNTGTAHCSRNLRSNNFAEIRE
jgi:hypothetical protein